jgi:allantoin racemase
MRLFYQSLGVTRRKMGEMAAGRKRLTGYSTSKRLTYAPPSGDLLDDIRRTYGSHVYPGAR